MVRNRTLYVKLLVYDSKEAQKLEANETCSSYLAVFFNGWHITLTEYLSSKDVNLQDSIVYLQMENEKVRGIPHTVVAPLAVSGKCSLYT